VTGPSASDLKAFYALFGFIHNGVEEHPNLEYIRVLSGGAWSNALILKLTNPSGDVLEIIEPSWSSEHQLPEMAQGWSHLAFSVSSCDEAVHHIVENGGLLVGGPTTNPDAPFRVAYVRDPAANLIELVETLSRPVGSLRGASDES
jgi:catechol 2,3-dioxygenase-like lactoylglutathione lyase family enzyme